MVNDIFGAKSQRFGGAFSADDAFVQFGLSRAQESLGDQEAGLAIDQTQFSFQQRIGKAYDVTSPVVYVIRGRSQGDGTFGQIAGVRALTEQFMITYGDVCAMDENILVFSTRSGCGTRRVVDERFSLVSLVLTGFSQSVTAEDMMIRRNLPFTFLSLVHGDS